MTRLCCSSPPTTSGSRKGRVAASRSPAPPTRGTRPAAPPLPPTPLRASDSPATEDPILLGVSDDRMPLEGVIQVERPGQVYAQSKIVSTRDPITPDCHSSFVFMFVFDSHIRLVCSGRYIGLLAGEDLLCLLIFSAFGRLSHGLPVLDAGTFKTAYPFIAGWLLSAYSLPDLVMMPKEAMVLGRL